MSDTEKQNWERIRAKGHAHFVIYHGLIRQGIPFGLTMTIGLFLGDILTHTPQPSAWARLGSFVFSTLVFGYGMSETQWKKKEKLYRGNHG